MSINKKNPILFCLIFSVCLLWQAAGAYAQTKDNVVIKIKKIERQGDNLFINLDFNFDKLDLKTHEQLVLRPVLKDDQNMLELPPVVVNGKRRYKVYLRQQAFGNSIDDHENATVIKSDPNTKRNFIPYAVTIPYEEWMSGSNLYLHESSCPGCGLAQTPISELLLSNSPILSVDGNTSLLSPLVTFVVPDGNYSKTRTDKKSAYLKFPIGSSQIIRTFGDNATELDKVDQIIEGFIYDEHVSVSKIRIQGLASVEGTYMNNLNLSESRAKSFESYLRNKYRLSPSLFETTWSGEDWAGLRSLVEKGYMPQKESVLQIVDWVDIFDGREKQLMDLNHGEAYRFMLANYFPLLRKVDYTIEFTVNTYDTQENMKIFETQPNYLTPRELFEISERYDKMSDEFKKIMDVSVENNPTDLAVNINAAAVYILRSKLDVAEYYLTSAGNSAAAFNNRGVVMMMKGQYNEAQQLFRKAKELGSTDAEHNLKELEKIGDTNNP